MLCVAFAKEMFMFITLLQSQPVEMYLNSFAHVMSQYLQSVEGIAAIFNYMVGV